MMVGGVLHLVAALVSLKVQAVGYGHFLEGFI